MDAGVFYLFFPEGEGFMRGEGRNFGDGGGGLRTGDMVFTRGTGQESPSHGFAVPAPFRQGGQGRGVRIATTSLRTGLAMTWFFVRGAGVIRRADRGVRPYEGVQGVRWVIGRRGGGTPPYGFARNFVQNRGGRGRTPPLRKFWRLVRAGRCRHRPLRRELGRKWMRKGPGSFGLTGQGGERKL